MKSKNKGITLIAIVITIIILLILAGISIATLTGENGVLTKASKAKEESLIKQYEEEINLIIIDEISERKIKQKEETFIESLDNKIKQKKWVETTKKCNETGTEQTPIENNNRLIVTTQEGYEIIIEVDNEKLIAKIIDISKTDKIEEDNTEENLNLNLGITDNKITEGTNISIEVTATRKLQKIELNAKDVIIYSEENIGSKTYNKTNIGIEQLKNLDQLPFLDNMTVTLEATTASGAKETKTLENVKNYTISTATQLNQLADVVNSGNNLQNETIVQLADIDVNPGKWTENEDGTTTFQSDAKEWRVIGSENYDYDSNSSSNIKSFAGIFDGKKHDIKGIYINNIAKDVVGVFSRNEGTIKNVILKNSSIKGRYLIGGIVSISIGTIENCKNYASISGTRCLGGICSISVGTLDSNTNYGKILSTVETGWRTEAEQVGGITGWGGNTITKCENYGSVESVTSGQDVNKVVAGIVGMCDYVSVNDCYNKGNIYR